MTDYKKDFPLLAGSDASEIISARCAQCDSNPSLYRLSLADKTGTDTETYGADGKSGSEGDAGAATV